VELGWYLERLGSFVGKTLDLREDALLRILYVLFATSDGNVGLGRARFLSTLAADNFLITVVEIDLNAKLVSNAVDTLTTRANNTADILLVNIELDRLRKGNISR
jgi:hypothetical protein